MFTREASQSSFPEYSQLSFAEDLPYLPCVDWVVAVVGYSLETLIRGKTGVDDLLALDASTEVCVAVVVRAYGVSLERS